MYSTLVQTADKADDPLPFIIPLPSLQTFAAMMFVLGQCQSIIELFLKRNLSEFRNQAYQSTVASRGKDKSWWTPYQEEWEEPPYAKAQKNSKKAKLYMRLASPIFRIFVLRGACGVGLKAGCMLTKMSQLDLPQLHSCPSTLSHVSSKPHARAWHRLTSIISVCSPLPWRWCLCPIALLWPAIVDTLLRGKANDTAASRSVHG